MRFSSSVILALPLLAAAAESPFEQYKAQFQNFLGNILGTGAKEAPAAAPEPKTTGAKTTTKTASKQAAVLTLDNWKDTLYGPVKSTTVPEEWWVLVTGGNKTCFGHCLTVETAFNESVAKASASSKSPHWAYLNCESQPVLCNSWSASTGTLWVFEMLPQPAPIDVYVKRLNLTTTTAQTILDLQSQGTKEGFKLHDGWFHPFDGPLAKYGLAVPLGYVFWFFNVVPSWAMMLGISFLSRSMMSRRMDNNMNRPRAAGAGAPPGDAR